MMRMFRRRPGDRIGDELRAHIERRAADLSAKGAAPEDALRQARVDFGVLEIYEAQCRREQRLGVTARFAGGLRGDVIYAWRRLRATPLFTIFAVVSLAVGVGVTTAVYSLVRATLWKPPGIANPDAVVLVVGSSAFYGGRPTWLFPLSRADFDDLAAAQRSFSHVAASTVTAQGIGDDTRARMATIEGVTGSYFPIFGVHAIAGRVLDVSDDAAGAQVAVISQAYWRTALSSDSGAVGRTIRIAGRPFQIVGIAHESFDGIGMHPARQTSAWVPLKTLEQAGIAATPAEAERRSRRQLTVAGRLRGGAGAAQASAELATIGGRLDTAFPIQVRTIQGTFVAGARGWTGRTVSQAHAEMSQGSREFGLLITILISMVLVVACTNLANLMLARGSSRAMERAIQQALGASRWRLIRQYGIEAGIIAALGGIAAYAVTRTLLVQLTLEVPLAQGQIMRIAPELSVDALAVAVAGVLLSLVVFGVGPAMQLTRDNTRGTLAGSSGSVGVRNRRSQRRLVRWQVAIASAFFIVASLFMKSVIAEARHDSGIDLDRIAVAVIDFELQRWEEPRARYAIDRALEQASRQPAIERSAAATGLPYGISRTPYSLVTRGGEAFVKHRIYPDALTIAATPELFATLGVEILRGRGFDQRDAAGAPRVAVLSETTAVEVFGTTDAVGRQLAYQVPRQMAQGPALEADTASVIGIARDTDVSNLTNRGRSGVLYLPLTQQYSPKLVLVARSRGNSNDAAAALRTAVAQASPGLAISQSGTGRSVLAGFYYFARAIAAGISGLGLLALLLAMVGLYGVLSQGVTMRTREVGLRIALGAERRAISRMILREGFRPIVEGIALGLFFGFAGRAVIRATLDGNVALIDPVAIIFVPIPVVIAGFLACYLPARRAAEVDPNVALRAL